MSISLKGLNGDKPAKHGRRRRNFCVLAAVLGFCCLQLLGPTTTGTAREYTSDATGYVDTLTAPYIDTDNSRLDLLDVDNITLMHVGKTGGSTLRSYALRVPCTAYGSRSRRNACLKVITSNESLLSKRTIGVVHVEIIFPRGHHVIERSKAFLFTIRDPVARFISAYGHQTPNKCLNGVSSCTVEAPSGGFKAEFYFFCFPTLGHVVTALEDPDAFHPANSSFVAATTCLDMLQSVFLQVGFRGNNGALSYSGGHFKGNYRYYVRFLKRSLSNHSKLLAIRTEYLWADTSTLDIQLGGLGNFSSVENDMVTHGSEGFSGVQKNFGYTTPINPLCCALWPDMLAYRHIVDNAVNLHMVDKQETYEITFRQCAVSSWKELYKSCEEFLWNVSDWWKPFNQETP